MRYWDCGYVESILVSTPNKYTEVLTDLIPTAYFYMSAKKRVMQICRQSKCDKKLPFGISKGYICVHRAILFNAF